MAGARRPEDFVVSDEALSVEPYGIMLSRDDPEFKRVADEAITTLFRTGEIFRLYQRWFQSPIPPRGMNLQLPMHPAMRKVVLPQAVRTMMPSFVNQAVITLKDTSILSVIGIAELTQTGKIIIARNFESFNMWLIVGIFYFVIIMALTKLSARLEKRINA